MHVLIYWSRPIISRGCVYFCTAGASIDLSVLVYNYPWDASIVGTLVHVWFYWSRSTIIYGIRLFLHCWCMYGFIGPNLQSSMGCVYFCTAGAFIDLSVSVYSHPRDESISALPLHLSFYWSRSTIIQGMRLLMEHGCIYWSRSKIIHGMRLFLRLLIYRSWSTIIQGMRLLVDPWCIVRVYWSQSTIIQWTRLFLHCRCMYCFIRLGLQSSKGCVYRRNVGACMGLLVPFYNHPWDAFIDLSVSVFNHPRDVHCWCIYRFIGLSLQSFKGCIYYGIVGTCIGLLVLVYNHPRDASISALLSIIIQGLLVHLLVYRSRFGLWGYG